ncbi:MFS transporter [Rhodoligotrophos defluvii]|uniref:MFS transporter n=1 Tax=Rhodoligotrophos defluvii TaxID=2561934 RepID=UPI0010C96705|nr:MFS transporter [Rhodoligotrophos defluvii]
MHSIQLRLSAALVAVLVAALALISYQTTHRAEALLLPELERKAATVARSVGGLMGRALEVGIPVSQLRGMDEYLARILATNADFSAVTIAAPDGRKLYGAGEAVAADHRAVSVPVGPPQAPAALVSVALDPAFAQSIIYKMWIDLAIVTVVTALVALELVYISFGAGLYGAIEGVESRVHAIGRGDLRLHPPIEEPSEFGRLAKRIDARLTGLNRRFAELRAKLLEQGSAAAQHALGSLQQRFRLGETGAPQALSVIAIRAPLFVFMFAEELTRPFLPIYIEQLASPIPGLSPTLVISLPMVVFLAIVALTQPVLGGLTERYGRRRSLLCGAAFGVAGYCASAFATDLLGLTLARALSAIGFALVFVGAQGFVIDNTSASQRARGMAVFIGAILVAGLCGPPIGGIIADRIGIKAAFLIAGAFAGASLLMALICLPPAPGRAAAGPPIRARDFAATLRSPRLTVLFFCCAMPAKILLVALCFFLVPLHMKDLGQDQASIGRMLMIYPLLMVLLVPTFASLADRWDRRTAFVVGGALIAGLGCLLVLLDEKSLLVIGATLACLGIGQAVSIASQSALVGEYGKQLAQPVGDGALYGIFRLVERTGNALGPVIAGFLLGLYGFATTVVLIGLMVAAGALIFTVTATGLRDRAAKPTPDMIGGHPA